MLPLLDINGMNNYYKAIIQYSAGIDKHPSYIAEWSVRTNIIAYQIIDDSCEFIIKTSAINISYTGSIV